LSDELDRARELRAKPIGGSGKRVALHAHDATPALDDVAAAHGVACSATQLRSAT
jgi:hypothetical protein